MGHKSIAWSLVIFSKQDPKGDLRHMDVIEKGNRVCLLFGIER